MTNSLPEIQNRWLSWRPYLSQLKTLIWAALLHFTKIIDFIKIWIFDYKPEKTTSRWCINSFRFGPDKKCNSPSSSRRRESLFTYSSPSSFQHHHAHHYRCQKLCEWSMNSGWWRERYGRLCRGGGGGYTQVSTPQFWPAMARLGHLSIQEGPRRCPHYAGPCSTTRRAHGEEGCASSPLPPSPCLSVTTPIGKTSNMNSNKHNKNPAAARTLNGCWRWWWIIEATSISQRDVRTTRAINWIITCWKLDIHALIIRAGVHFQKNFIIQPAEAINHLFIFHDACLMKYVKRMKFL